MTKTPNWTKMVRLDEVEVLAITIVLARSCARQEKPDPVRCSKIHVSWTLPTGEPAMGRRSSLLTPICDVCRSETGRARPSCSEELCR